MTCQRIPLLFLLVFLPAFSVIPAAWQQDLPEAVRTELLRRKDVPGTTRTAVLLNRMKISPVAGQYSFETVQVLRPAASGGVLRLPHPRGHAWSAVRLTGPLLEQTAVFAGARLEEGNAGTQLVLRFDKSDGLILLQRGGRRSAQPVFFHTFEPFFSTAGLFAELDIDVGKQLSWRLDPALPQLAPETAGTRYRFRFSHNTVQDAESRPLLHLASATDMQALGDMFRDLYYGAHRALDGWVERMSGNYADGLGQTNLQAAYIYDALLGESLNLRPGLLPDTAGWEIVNSQAEFVRRFLRFMTRIGVRNAVVIPLLDGEDCRPVGSPGVLLHFGEQTRWYFPETFHAPPNHVPLLLRGRPCLLVDGSGEISRSVLPDPAGEQDRIHISLTGTVSRSGALGFTLRSTLAGQATIHLRDLLDSLNEENLQKRLERMLLGSRPGYTATRFEVFHRRVLFHQPQILLRGSFHLPVERGLLRFLPPLPISALEEDEAAWGPATGATLRVRLILDARARVSGMPRPVTIENRFFKYSLEAKLLPVHVPRKPRNWTRARWQNHLRQNPPRRAPVLELTRSYVPTITPRGEADRRARNRALQAVVGAEAALAGVRISR